LCGCGQRGCLEKYASASSVVRHFNEAEEQNPQNLQNNVNNDSKNNENSVALVATGAKDVFKYCEDGNVNAVRVINEVSCFLLYMLIVTGIGLAWRWICLYTINNAFYFCVYILNIH